jgi:hypothetical protein
MAQSGKYSPHRNCGGGIGIFILEAVKVEERTDFKRVWTRGKQQVTMSVFMRALGFMKNGSHLTLGNRVEDYRKE